MVDQEEFYKKVIQWLNNPEDESGKRDIEHLINDSQDYRRIYDQIIYIWTNSSELRKLEQIDEDVAVQNIEKRLGDVSVFNDDKKVRFAFSRWLAVAAVVLIGLVAYKFYNRVETPKFIFKSTQGAIDSVTLADGSKIYLDAFSELKFPEVFKGEIREISLIKGQAFFKIHRDTTRPFIVQIRHSSVKVLGTSFNINSRDNQIALNVKTGVVKFQPLAIKDDGSILHAGTGITYNESTGKEVVLRSVNHNNQYWLTHELDFIDASLTDVCKQLNAYYKVNITLSGNISAFKKFNAHFKDNTLSDVLEVLRDTYPIKIKELNKGSIIIKPIDN